jgi:hypothetical protein
MGLGKLFLVFGAFVVVMMRWKQKQLTPNAAFSLLAALLLLDLAPAFKYHSFYVMNPFHSGATLYPEPQPVRLEDGRTVSIHDLDLKHYRVNRPAGLTRPPLFEAMFSNDEPLSAFWQLYGVRSYGGYVNLSSYWYSGLYYNFNDLKLWKGAYTDQTSERFLDLFGVQYSYQPEDDALHLRPHALSRFMWFSNFEVLDDKATLQRLKQLNFNPRQTLIVQANPGLPPGDGTPGRKLEYRQMSSDEMYLDLSMKRPGLVFFNDSYHPGWTASVNGVPVNVQRAHYNFMAVPVPGGPAKVVFRFDPPPFKAGLQLAGVGLLVFVLAAVRIGWQARRQEKNDATFPDSQPHRITPSKSFLQHYPLMVSGLGALLIFSLLQLIFDF